MTSEWYDLEYAVIHATSFGKGKPLFLLPGWPLSSKIYGLLEPYLADRYRVTSIDLPGWAGQSKFKTDCEATVGRYVEVVKDSLDVIYPKDAVVNIGGISAGGTLALLAAGDIGSKIGRIVVQSLPYDGVAVYQNNRFWTSLIGVARFVPPLGFVLRKYYKYMYLGIYDRYRLNVGITIKDELLADYQNLRPEVVLEFAHDLFSSDYSDLFRKIENEVIAIGCGKDDLIPSETMERLSKNILPNAKYYEIAEGTHNILLENPRELSQVIIDNI